nr:unnamed protein product [Callosobruchus chinensis]
MFAGGRSG